jgi:hypothetical protein
MRHGRAPAAAFLRPNASGPAALTAHSPTCTTTSTMTLFRTTLLLALAMYASADISKSTMVDLGDMAVSIGAGFYSATDAVFPASDGTTMGVYETHDAETIAYSLQPIGAMPMTASGDKSTGIAMAGGMGGIAMQAAGADGFVSLMDKMPAPLFVTQDIKYNKASGIWSVTANFLQSSLPVMFGGVATSADDGATWNMAPLPPKTFCDNGYVRYASAPSADVMYIDAGSWPMGSTAGLRGVKRHHVNQRMSVDTNGELSYAPVVANGSGDVPAGYWAQVAKTTDGGATWEIILDDSTSGYYPNDIDCFDEDHCAMAVEGVGASGASYGAIMTTADGGATWSTSDKSQAVSMMGAKMTSKTEAWGAGGTPQQTGAFFQTTDLVNWDMATTDPADRIGEMTSIDFDGNGDPWGTGMRINQASCIVHAKSA